MRVRVLSDETRLTFGETIFPARRQNKHQPTTKFQTSFTSKTWSLAQREYQVLRLDAGFTRFSRFIDDRNMHRVKEQRPELNRTGYLVS